jgi:hypothetical protein
VRRAAVALVVLVATACEGERNDPLAEYAAASCAAVQAWVDAIEDYTTELSHAVTPLDDASDRVGHYRAWTHSLVERTDDTIRQLKRLAPAAGHGRDAADYFVSQIERTKHVTEELVVLAESFPDGDDDPEPLISRISSLLIRMEKGFAHATKARDELARRYPVFDEVRSCTDYDNPVT